MDGTFRFVLVEIKSLDFAFIAYLCFIDTVPFLQTSSSLQPRHH
jgi:hypothetical protein